MFSLEVTFFVFWQKIDTNLQILLSYCLTFKFGPIFVSWHDKKCDFLEIDMRRQKAFDPTMQVPQKLHWSTTCGPSCICHTVWEYFVWPICFVGCHWFAILCILLILLGRLYLGVTLRPPQDQKKDVCMIRVFNLVAGVCITMLWICIFSFMHKYMPCLLYLFIWKKKNLKKSLFFKKRQVTFTLLIILMVKSLLLLSAGINVQPPQSATFPRRLMHSEDLST